jgi:hypothetical protein
VFTKTIGGEPPACFYRVRDHEQRPPLPRRQLRPVPASSEGLMPGSARSRMRPSRGGERRTRGLSLESAVVVSDGEYIGQ